MNALALLIFMRLGSDSRAMRIIISIYTVLIVLWVLLSMKFIPNIMYLKSETAAEKNKEALQGLIKALLCPKVWLSGLISMAIYTTYITVVYSVPYMQNVFLLSPSQAIAFGLFTASGIGVVGGVLGGFLGDRVFKSPVKMLSISLTINGYSFTRRIAYSEKSKFFICKHGFNVYIFICNIFIKVGYVCPYRRSQYTERFQRFGNGSCKFFSLFSHILGLYIKRLFNRHQQR